MSTHSAPHIELKEHTMKTRINIIDSHTLTIAIGTLLATAASAHGAITSTSGSAFFLGAAPVNTLYGALPGLPAYCWDEQSGVTASGVGVNITSNGFYTGAAPFTGVVSGTFDSHFIHFDASSGVANATGGVTFSSQIRAVIYQNVLLDATDLPFGSFGTTYATFDPFRSEAAALMLSQLTVSGNTLNFTLWAQNAAMQNRMSEVRVLTDAVPAPGACALLGLSGLIARRRRR